jgi:uncharacterized cupin superfamily protein
MPERPRVNLGRPEFQWDDDDPEGFRAGMMRIGPGLGATATGISLYDLPPGQAICPYHYEYGEEEWLVVVEGRPVLRHPEGEDVLEPWDAVCFPPGPDGAHSVRNPGQDPVRVLMFSSLNHPAATVYPDSGKVGVWTGNRADDLIVRRSSAVDYFDGESGSAGS